jgi:hypothetical protein
MHGKVGCGGIRSAARLPRPGGKVKAKLLKSQHPSCKVCRHGYSGETSVVPRIPIGGPAIGKCAPGEQATWSGHKGANRTPNPP